MRFLIDLFSHVMVLTKLDKAKKPYLNIDSVCFQPRKHFRHLFNQQNLDFFELIEGLDVRIGWSNVTMVRWIQINRCLLPKGARPLYID